MRVTPVTEQQAEAQSSNLLAPGTYDFEVKDASDEISKASGSEMIKLELFIYDQDGKKRTVFDYLVSHEKAAWKIRHFAEACHPSLLAQYEGGMLMPQEIVGRTGQCVIVVRPARDNYAASNSVRDYVKAEDVAAAQQAGLLPPNPRKSVPAGKGTDLDDEIPFGPCWQ